MKLVQIVCLKNSNLFHCDDEVSINQPIQSPDQEYNPGEVPGAVKQVPVFIVAYIQLRKWTVFKGLGGRGRLQLKKGQQQKE